MLQTPDRINAFGSSANISTLLQDTFFFFGVFVCVGGGGSGIVVILLVFGFFLYPKYLTFLADPMYAKFKNIT